MTKHWYATALILAVTALCLGQSHVKAQSSNLSSAVSEKNWETVQRILLKDLEKVASPGLPGAVSAFNQRSFALILGRSGKNLQPVIAAGELPGRNPGRIVLFGHDGYLDRSAFDAHDTGKLITRLTRWAAEKPESSRTRSQPVRIGLISRHNLSDSYQADGMQVRLISGDWTKQINSVDVLVMTAGDVRSTEQAQILSRFLAKGGGLLFGITGWGWEQISGGKKLVDAMPLSPLLAEAGLAVTSQTAEATGNQAMLVVPINDLNTAHAGLALNRLEASMKKRPALNPTESAMISETLLYALRSTKPDEPSFRKPLVNLVGNVARREISPKRPLKDSDLIERLAIQVDLELEKRSKPESIKASPSAAIFPGSVVRGTPKIKKTLTLEKGNRGRMGTGLYAAPGTVVEVIVDKGQLPQNSRLRIGAHSDTLWHWNSWQRHPEISHVFGFSTDQNLLRAASSMGGLIYVESDRPLDSDLTLEFRNVVQASHYVLGKTSMSDWKRLRNSGAPWAELQSHQIGLILPASSVKELEDPKPLLELWDRIMNCQEELGAINPPYRPIQWIVPDVQISAGYMHSGNPIMTFMDVVPWFSRTEKVLASDPGGVSWGILHEIGHNRQHGEWTPGGLGEVTNNLFALYVYDKMLGKPSFGHPGLLTGQKRREAVNQYRETGPSFNKFKGDPFLALSFFMEMQEVFGWEPFIRFFEESDKLPPENRPRSDQARWDGWLTGMSRATGHNLGPYFEFWGIPVTPVALSEIKALKPWQSPVMEGR
ncbi:MAG: hypothetical protein RJA81_2214 [Planctomycetota bacterium]|jgi:hypothetical protein